MTIAFKIRACRGGLCIGVENGKIDPGSARDIGPEQLQFPARSSKLLVGDIPIDSEEVYLACCGSQFFGIDGGHEDKVFRT